MLSPEYLDQAGDMVAAVYGEIEADMLAYLEHAMLDLDDLGQRSTTALNLLSQTHSTQLRSYINAHEGEIDEAVKRTVEDALTRADAADTVGLGNAAKEATSASRPRQVDLTVTGIAAILERDNVDMVQGALRLWNETVAEAVTQINTGAQTTERALHQAVRKMAAAGITTVTYRNAKTGAQTVTNHIDVAIRRHLRTQLLQDAMRRTEQICADAGVELVEVSSHGGARPSHAKWQGRVYSLHGAATINGVRYKDFYTETNYGSVDGLGGANCRHSFGPYRPGTARKYDPNPEHPSGLDNDEVYKLTQGQRYRERAIRKTKRELTASQLIYEQDGTQESLVDALVLQKRLRAQQADMRAFIADANAKGKADVLQRSPRREWAGDMPSVALVTKHGSERMAERGVTAAQVADAVANPLKRCRTKTDDQGRKSQKLIGRYATVTRNPDTGGIVTVYRTKTKYRNELERKRGKR